MMAVRFILLVKASAESEAGEPPSTELVSAVMRYNEQLAAAGVLVSADGIHQSATGVRVSFSAAGSTVTEGPFGNVDDLVAGYWILEVGSRDDAIDWARRVPFTSGQIEVRKIVEADDYCGALIPELAAG